MRKSSFFYFILVVIVTSFIYYYYVTKGRISGQNFLKAGGKVFEVGTSNFEATILPFTTKIENSPDTGNQEVSVKKIVGVTDTIEATDEAQVAETKLEDKENKYAKKFPVFPKNKISINTAQKDNKDLHVEINEIKEEVYTKSELFSQLTQAKGSKEEDVKRRYPQALIGGVKKCGTRALLSFLSEHPSVRSAGKEMHFFDKDENYLKGLDYYLNQMPLSRKHELTIEKTPAYFVSPSVPERVYNFSRKVKLIFIFREPVVRVISDYAQSLAKKGNDSRSIEQNVLYRTRHQVNANSPMVKVGIYVQHLLRWLKYFPMKQMLFVDGDKFIKNPTSGIIETQKFLNLPVLLDEDAFFYNTTKGFYCLNIRDTTSNSSRQHCLSPSKGRKHPFVKKSTEKILREFYKPYNKQFFDLIGKDFGWPI